MSVLVNEIHSLEKDLETIESSEQFIKFHDQEKNSQIEFLINHSEMKENLENFIAKPFKKSIDVVPFDLPREMNSIRQIHNKKDSLIKSIE